MALKIRSGDLDADRSAAIGLLSRYVNPAYDRRRFDWLYHENPVGRGRLWVAIDGSSGDLIGTAGAFPRRMTVDGRSVTSWVLADFCVADTHRTLGPALQLQRACLEDLTADGIPFCYDFPSRSMEAIYRRLGQTAQRRIVRFARPLRVRGRLRLGWGAPLAYPLAAVADLVLGRTVRAPRVDGSLTVAVHEGPCGEEFSALAQLAGPSYGVCVVRSAEYLNWRYRETPRRYASTATSRSPDVSSPSAGRAFGWWTRAAASASRIRPTRRVGSSVRADGG